MHRVGRETGLGHSQAHPWRQPVCEAAGRGGLALMSMIMTSNAFCLSHRFIRTTQERESDVSAAAWSQRPSLTLHFMHHIPHSQYDKDNMSEKVVRQLKRVIEDPQFTPDQVAKQSKASMSMCLWVRAMDTYAKVSKVGVLLLCYIVMM